MRRDRRHRPGESYRRRVDGVNAIYDRYAPSGIPNREIWRRYVYPVYGVSERTFYNLLKAPQRESYDSRGGYRQLTLFEDGE